LLDLDVYEPLDDDDEEHGELRVYFDVKTWDVKNDGLIYTDKQFIRELHQALKLLGFTDSEVKDVYYTEQGMQGRDFVSLEANLEFINGFRRVFAKPVNPRSVVSLKA
jgi:hypothetical protein